jgi:hypothetical protein
MVVLLLFFSFLSFFPYEIQQHSLVHLPKTPPWREKFRVQELQLAFNNFQDFGGGISLPFENLNIFEYFVYILNYWVGSSQLILMKDILEAFDDKMGDFISFIKDF